MWAVARRRHAVGAAGVSLDFTAGLPAGVTVNSSPAGYAKTSSGSLTAFAANVGRVTDLGLLVEPAATNYATYSSDPTQAGMGLNTPSFATWVSGKPDPTGGTAAKRLQEDTTTNRHITIANPMVSGLTAGQNYTMSFMFKAGGRGFVRGGTAWGDSRDTQLVVDLTSGAIVAQAGGYTSLSYTDVYGSWIRLVVPMPSYGTTSVGAIIENFLTSSTNSYLGDGASGVDVWGIQVELGLAATSPINTSGAAATRAADNISFTIPSGVAYLTYTFSDNSTQVVAVTSGPYTIPTNLRRPQIKSIVGWPSAPPYLGQFATRAMTMNGYAGTSFTYARGRCAHISRSSVTSVKVGYAGFWLNSSTYALSSLAGTTSVRVAIEYPSGTFTQVLFGGNALGSIGSGAILISDAAGVSIPAGATFWTRVWLNNASGVAYVAGTQLQEPSSLGETAEFTTSVLGDNTMGGAYGTNTFPNSANLPPILLLSTMTDPSVLIIGDSIGTGSSDISTASGDYGAVAKSIGPAYGYGRHVVPGVAAAEIKAHTALTTLAQYYTHTICQLGVNDIFARASSAATTLSDLQTVWGLVSSTKVYQTTLTPESTTTDSWATTANQTAKSQTSTRNTFNTTLRALPSGVTGYFEVADAVESSRDSGKWKVDGTANKWTSDGVHPSGYGYQQIVTLAAIPTASIVR